MPTHVWLHPPLFTAHSLISKTNLTKEQYSAHQDDTPSDTWRVIDLVAKFACGIVDGSGDPQGIDGVRVYN